MSIVYIDHNHVIIFVGKHHTATILLWERPVQKDKEVKVYTTLRQIHVNILSSAFALAAKCTCMQLSPDSSASHVWMVYWIRMNLTWKWIWVMPKGIQRVVYKYKDYYKLGEWQDINFACTDDSASSVASPSDSLSIAVSDWMDEGKHNSVMPMLNWIVEIWSCHHTWKWASYYIRKLKKTLKM